MESGAMRFPVLLLATALLAARASAQAPRPNIIFILADDLGYGELGCYGQALIQTPNLDRLAADGMRFTQFYAGSTVCAPSRSVLMTGRHTGHTTVRGNAGGPAQSLAAGDITVARVLHDAGYATGLVGKWGLGEIGEPGEPRAMGFDYYFGYLNQTHAHNAFPDFLWRDGQRVALPNDLTPMGKVPGAGYATKRAAYAGDLFRDDALGFIERHAAQPFFLYLSVIAPHANDERARALKDGNEAPDYAPYAGQPWTDSAKGHAAVITRLDSDVGALIARLKKLGLDERTLVIFTSDNGPHNEGGPDYDPDFFHASGPLRGLKRDLSEGGIRVPFLARWPGKVRAGGESAHAAYFGDMMATFAELAGAKTPAPTDSVSLAPTLLGRGVQPKHDYLYWEFHEGGVSQAVLLDGRWKAVRLKSVTAPIELFDLAADIGEKHDVASTHSELVARAAAILRTAHVDNEHWKIPAR